MQMAKQPGPMLGLVGDGASLRLERRRVLRYATTGEAMADIVGPNGEHTIASVDLADSSACGLGLLSKAPLEVDGFVRIFIGQHKVPARAGRVARCVPEIDAQGKQVGYRIGLDTGYAAAA